MIILSSPLGFPGATIEFIEVAFPSDLTGCQTYCGHPATRALLEALGAEYVPGKWAGPEVGEVFLAVPLVQSVREPYTKDVVVEDISGLKAILCRRIA